MVVHAESLKDEFLNLLERLVRLDKANIQLKAGRSAQVSPLLADDLRENGLVKPGRVSHRFDIS